MIITVDMGLSFGLCFKIVSDVIKAKARTLEAKA
jgi:hypothetical protein